MLFNISHNSNLFSYTDVAVKDGYKNINDTPIIDIYNDPDLWVTLIL